MLEDHIINKFKKFVGSKFRCIEKECDDLSNTIYLINEAYIVRDSAKIKDPNVNFKQEKSILDAIENLDLSEKIIYFNKVDGSKIARKLKQSNVYYSTEKSNLISFIRAIKKLHNLKIEGIREFDLINAINYYKKGIDSKYLLDEKFEHKFFDKIIKLNDNLPKVISHNFLEKRKVIFLNDKVKLVDFRYSCYNSPIFDLAYFSNIFDLTSEQDELLLDKYFGHKKRIKHTKILSTYKKYIDVLNYYRYTYYFSESGELSYFIEANKLQKKIITY